MQCNIPFPAVTGSLSVITFELHVMQSHCCNLQLLVHMRMHSQPCHTHLHTPCHIRRTENAMTDFTLLT